MSETLKNHPIPSPHSSQDSEPDTIATPEGDNEYPPDVPLGSIPEGLHTPPGYGSDGNVYNNDQKDQQDDVRGGQDEKPSGIVKFIDEIARGEFM